jgi:hypothetical protein
LSPDIRQHRGAHPTDKFLFSEDQLPVLREAVSQLSWLLTRRYALASSLKLVGDRHSLSARQRQAVSRAACSDESLDRRGDHCVTLEEIKNEKVMVDGFNLIITVEAALSGAMLLLCRDNCIRDLASVHGSYRSVQETESAIGLIGEALETYQPLAVTWLLDRPVSNSGRLAQKILDVAAEHNWRWSVDVLFNPDSTIISSLSIAITSDSAILDHVWKWVNLKSYLVEHHLRRASILDLSKC